MLRVSSNATLGLKFFFPILYTVFYGAMTIAAWTTNLAYYGNIPATTFRIVVTVLFLLGILFFYWAFLRLKRVDADDRFLYVTNYFKTYKYPYHNVERIKMNSYGPFRSASLLLKVPGTFGHRITFLPSRSNFGEFRRRNPDLFQARTEPKPDTSG